MNNDKWMIVYKDGFTAKIVRFFKKIFKRKEKYVVIHQENTKTIENKEKQEKFINDIRVDSKLVDNVSKREEFLKEINGNREALEKLSIDRLKVLEKYYDEEIEKKEKQIKKLQESA